MLWLKGICTQCGTHPEVWLDEDGEAVEPPPYIVDTRKCLGCASLEEGREQIPKDNRFVIQTYLQKNRKGTVKEGSQSGRGDSLRSTDRQ